MAEDNTQNTGNQQGIPASGQPVAGGAGAVPTPPMQGGAPMPPMGGMPAPGAQGMGMSPGMPGDFGGSPMPPPPPKDEKPANFKLGSLFTEGIKITLPEHPDTQIDESNFLFLLASSISLSRAEKKRIIDAVPKLKQWQVDELVTIFDEEHKKFAQLSERHVPQLEKLAKQHFEEWKDIEMEQQQVGKKQEDQAKADEIKKSLGL